MELTTERLLLRPWTLDDAPAAYPIYGDPEVTQYIGGHTVANLQEMRDQLTTRMERTKRYGPGLGAWAIIAGQTLVGCGLLKYLPDAQEVPTADVEVGWHLGRAHWGKGYASEAGRGLLRHGFSTLGLSEIHAVVDPRNSASMRVASRIGMAHTGLTEAYYGDRLEHFLISAPQHR